jgi:hypothetical protein
VKSRLKPANEVRRDALATAVKKAQQGCRSCAEQYLDLAASNGATSNEIGLARRKIEISQNADLATRAAAREDDLPVTFDASLPTSEMTSEKAPPEETEIPSEETEEAHEVRLDVFPPEAGAGAAIATAKSETPNIFVPAVPAYTGLFGTDSNTRRSVGGMPQDFYFGKLGEGPGPTPPPQPTRYFNVDTATHTPANRVTGYWFMYGPQFRGSLSAHDYGYNQGLAARRAWDMNPYCCMRNVFADVEEGPKGQYGWGGRQADNVACVNGFLDGATTQAIFCSEATGRLVPGIYWNPSANGYIFPPSWTPSRPFVFWGTGSIGGQPSCPGDVNNCAPCTVGCDTLGPVQATWRRGVYRGCLGGMGVLVWQFWVGSCGCGGDWDYTPIKFGDILAPIGCR